MRVPSRLLRVGRWCATGARGLHRRLGLTVPGLWALGAAVLALATTLIVLGGVSEDVTQHNGLATSDASNLSYFTAHRSAALVRAARIVTDFGAVPIVAVIAVVGGVLLWRRGLPVAFAVAPAASLALAAVVTEVAKQLVGRTRPGIGLRLAAESEPSFPSGHATHSAAVYLTLSLIVATFVLRRPLARVATVGAVGLLVAGIGISRLVLGVHWPTDVVAGWALGGAVALGMTITATLMSGLMRADPPMPQGRLRRAGRRLVRLLTLERSSLRRHALRSA